MNKVQPLYDFSVPQEKNWMRRGIIWGTVIMSFAGYLAAFTQIVDWLVMLAMLSGMGWTAFCGLKSAAQKDAREDIYSAYLLTVDISLLRVASASPELDGESRSVIIQHLNKNHPGWSFAHV